MKPFRLPRKSKHGNKKTVIDGLTFDSGAEAERYLVNRDRESKGEISNLRCQVKYRLEVNGVLITTWKADFVYRDNVTGQEVVEDVKGWPNDRWPMKKKLMKAIYGITVREINVKGRKRK